MSEIIEPDFHLFSILGLYLCYNNHLITGVIMLSTPWNIQLDTNTVGITPEIAQELYEKTSENNIWKDAKDVISESRMNFKKEHMEHMDVLCWNSQIVDTLKKHKVKGLICFTSYEGANKGRAWGYDFDGLGNMFRLNGTMKWSRVQPHLNF